MLPDAQAGSAALLAALLTVAANAQERNEIAAEPEPVRGFVARKFGVEVLPLPYRLRIPKEIAEDERLPLLVAFHAESERGQDNLAQLRVLPRRIARSRSLRSFVLAPQLPRGAQWTDPGRIDQIEALARALSEEFPQIDPDRVYAAGHGFGATGAAAWTRAFPDRVAAALLADGAYADDPEPLGTSSAWIWHGGLDPIASPERARALAYGSLAAGSAVWRSVLDREGHASWSRAFDPEGAVAWLFARARGKVDPGPFLTFDRNGISQVDPLRIDLEPERFNPAKAGDLVGRVADGMAEILFARGDSLGRRLLVVGRTPDDGASVAVCRWPEALDRAFSTVQLSLALDKPPIDGVALASGRIALLFPDGVLALFGPGRDPFRGPLSTIPVNGASTLAAAGNRILVGGAGIVREIVEDGSNLRQEREVRLSADETGAAPGSIRSLTRFAGGLAIATEKSVIVYADLSGVAGDRWDSHGLERIDAISAVPGGRLAVHGPGRTVVIGEDRFLAGYEFPAGLRVRTWR